jgi:hypothetical protein
MQHYVIKFVSDLRQVGRWFSPGTLVSSKIKLTAMIQLIYKCIADSGFKHHSSNRYNKERNELHLQQYYIFIFYEV